MSTKISANAAKYSQDYYYRNFYSGERNARLSASRSHYTTDALIKADANALKKAATKLSDFEYKQSNGTDIYHAVLAFTDTYNNALDSSGDSDAHSISRLRKSIKNLTSDEKKALANIGITVKSNGSLEIDKDTLSSSRLANVKKVFSGTTFTASLKKYAKNLYNAEVKENMSNTSHKTVTDLLTSLAPDEIAAEAAVGGSIDISL